MADRRALVRVLDELLWMLRRGGFAIATSQAIDVARAVELVGFDERFAVREAVASIVVKASRERRRFDALFDQFFSSTREPASLWARLEALGFMPEELTELRQLLTRAAHSGSDGAQHLGALLERGAELDRLFRLAGVTRTLDSMQSRLQAGFFTHSVMRALGVPGAHRQLGVIADRLRDAFGDERGRALAKALRKELERAGDDVRAAVQSTFTRREEDARADEEATGAARRLVDTPFASMSESEMAEVRAAVRRFAERLRGGERVRRRRATKGRIDPHRTLRRALATGGVPFEPARKARVCDKPKLLLLCDVSDSVRQVARFMLELVYAAQELFDGTRSFVFVRELGETTDLFKREPVSLALGQAFGGGVVSVADNSNYGRVLRAFEDRHMRAVTRDTTVVILGDGRTNYHDDSADVLPRIRERARALYWLCPEPRGRWSTGDSAMARYAPACTKVLEVASVRDLEEATRLIVAAR